MIALVVTQSGLQFTTDIFMSSLCVSDLLASVLFQPFVISRLLAKCPKTSFEWALRRFVGQMTLSASSLSLFMVTVDRYLFLRLPLRHNNLVSKSSALFAITLVWFVSFAIGLTAYLERELAAFAFPFVITLIVAATVICQVLIFFIAEAQVKKIWNLSHTFECCNQPKYLKQMRATKTIILLLTVYLLSWLPSTVFRLYDRFSGGSLETFHRWLHVLNTLIQIHCCLDPYLYVFRNQRFRSTVKRLIKRRLGH